MDLPPEITLDRETALDIVATLIDAEAALTDQHRMVLAVLVQEAREELEDRLYPTG